MRPAAAVLVLAAAGLLALAGCGGQAPSPATGGSTAARLTGPALATSLTGSDGTSWAVVEMGGSAASFDNFWELFVRPAGGSAWKLATPAGVASNGGLVMAEAGAGTLVTGFRPSQHLTFSPLAASTDAGAQWQQNTLVDPGLANVPGALAGNPAGRLLALTDTGRVETAAGLGASWTLLTTVRDLAASAAGRACRLTTLTAVAWTPAGEPIVAGDCGRPGTAGIFTQKGGVWHAAGPPLAGPVARAPVDVVGLATTNGRTTAVLATDSGPAAAVLAAWSSDGGARWTLSPPLRTPGPAARAQVSVSFLADGSGLVLTPSAGHRTASRLVTIGWRAAHWDTLPPLPGSAADGAALATTLTASAGGDPQALVADRGTLSVWQLSTGRWTLAQTVRVAIPYGSSG